MKRNAKYAEPEVISQEEQQELKVKNRLEKIALAIKAGVNPESFQEELDNILGTNMEARDQIAEATWESDYRDGTDK